jgi:hypothetical protein
MDKLPENLSSLDDEALLEERDERDEILRPLFRRWPSLSRFEMNKLRRVYNERVRLAKWIGRTRRGTRRAPGG